MHTSVPRAGANRSILAVGGGLLDNCIQISLRRHTPRATGEVQPVIRARHRASGGSKLGGKGRLMRRWGVRMAVAPIFFQPFAPEVNTGLIYTLFWSS